MFREVGSRVLVRRFVCVGGAFGCRWSDCERGRRNIANLKVVHGVKTRSRAQLNDMPSDIPVLAGNGVRE